MYCWRLSRGVLEFVGYLGEPSQVAAGGRPLAVAAEVGREGGEGGAVREAARVVFESVGEGAGLGRPGAVDELEAGDQVARAVLRGGGAPLAVELVAEQGFRLVGARAAHGDPTRLGERGRDVREQGRDVLGGLGKLAEDEADAAAEGAQRAEHRAVGDAVDLNVDLLRLKGNGLWQMSLALCTER